MKRILIFVFLYFLITGIAVASNKFTNEQIGKACIAIVMGKDPSIIKLDKTVGDVIYLSYIRS